jgi:hypothetical protein
MNQNSDRIERMRRWLLWLLAFGLVGTGVELVLLEHYEEPTQLVPIGMIVLALFVMVWQGVAGGGASLTVLRWLMAAFVLAGAVGMVLHFRGAAEFQREIDPAMPQWQLIRKAMMAKAPPVLAAGTMMQLGLLGLIYACTNRKEGKES